MRWPSAIHVRVFDLGAQMGGSARRWPDEKRRCRVNAVRVPLAIYAAAPTPWPDLRVAYFSYQDGE